MIKLKTILALMLALLAAAPVVRAQQHKASPAKSLRLYVFDCGSLDIPDISPYQLKKGEVASQVMSAPCFLIVHPKGTMMWDTGAIPDNEFKPDGTGTKRYATSHNMLQAQLSEAGYAPTDITYLALSHFHWDHVANCNEFAGSTWLVRQSERDVMFADPPSPRTEPAGFSRLKNAKTTIITKDDYDVFGDGKVVIKAAPGHSPGHQVLFLRLAKTGPVVISGDLYHYPEERKLHKIPTTEFNAEQTVASRKVIEEFMMKTHAQLWIQHDFVANAKLKKSPAFYE